MFYFTSSFLYKRIFTLLFSNKRFLHPWYTNDNYSENWNKTFRTKNYHYNTTTAKSTAKYKIPLKHIAQLIDTKNTQNATHTRMHNFTLVKIHTTQRHRHTDADTQTNKHTQVKTQSHQIPDDCSIANRNNSPKLS